MHLAFSTLLHADAPDRNHRRAYRVEAGCDLFGGWLVEVTFGRIGARGRSLRRWVASEAEARQLVRTCLRRRSSAPRRIGVAYLPRITFDPCAWLADDRGVDVCA